MRWPSSQCSTEVYGRGRLADAAFLIAIATIFIQCCAFFSVSHFCQIMLPVAQRKN
jgi:hypothetical protein